MSLVFILNPVQVLDLLLEIVYLLLKHRLILSQSLTPVDGHGIQPHLKLV